MNELNVLLNRKNLLLIVGLALLVFLCIDGLEWMVGAWDREEYSHGYMIPLVALYLAWQKRETLMQEAGSGSVLGFVVLFAAVTLAFLGEISSIVTLIQYAFWLGVWWLVLLSAGVSGTKVIWAAVFYLVFMIPLPPFLYFNLSQELQLISSSLGVAVIRLFDISVYLEGNVIDLGVYQLQVVEACSGLRYLFPLMSFGFLISYIYRGPVWQKVVIFLSTIPITVVMNSFRIGVIGVTVEHFGIAAAEGFLHDFEGWIVFMACLGFLLFEIWILYMFSERKTAFSELFDLDFGSTSHVEKDNTEEHGSADDARGEKNASVSRSMLAGLALLIVATPFSYYFAERSDEVPERTSFIELPLNNNGWIGREGNLESNVLDTLKLTDYFIGNFARADDSQAVNLYTAWYEEQRKGASIHSPRTCLPGGGWAIQSHTIEAIDSVDAYGAPLNVNRVLMQMGDNQQLVYYWFQGRGRNVTNEYEAKWYIFWDSLTRNRTDGALMRLVTNVADGSDIVEEEQRLVEFLEVFYPQLSDYIPD